MLCSAGEGRASDGLRDTSLCLLDRTLVPELFDGLGYIFFKQGGHAAARAGLRPRGAAGVRRWTKKGVTAGADWLGRGPPDGGDVAVRVVKRRRGVCFCEDGKIRCGETWEMGAGEAEEEVDGGRGWGRYGAGDEGLCGGCACWTRRRVCWVFGRSWLDCALVGGYARGGVLGCEDALGRGHKDVGRQWGCRGHILCPETDSVPGAVGARLVVVPRRASGYLAFYGAVVAIEGPVDQALALDAGEMAPVGLGHGEEDGDLAFPATRAY
ncbi:hypothetical protein B0H11DRAFT_1914067 [Mycena galericulata]|nr:hypothetical protein B0H11DRAFT_1914067 [Mycena galericulata]